MCLPTPSLHPIHSFRMDGGESWGVLHCFSHLRSNPDQTKLSLITAARFRAPTALAPCPHYPPPIRSLGGGLGGGRALRPAHCYATECAAMCLPQLHCGIDRLAAPPLDPPPHTNKCVWGEIRRPLLGGEKELVLFLTSQRTACDYKCDAFW